MNINWDLAFPFMLMEGFWLFCVAYIAWAMWVCRVPTTADGKDKP